MNRICSVASGFLGSLGVALLLTSLLLIPQNLAVAQCAPPRCDGDSCDLTPCITYYTTYGNCPNTCTVGGLQRYCKCVSEPVTCPDCVCLYNSAGMYCDCRTP